MTYKQIRILLLIFLACLLLSSCSGKTRGITGRIDREEEGQGESGEEKNSKRLFTVGFSQAGHESYWRIEIMSNIRQVFSEENGYRLLFSDADNDPKVQAQVVRGFIRERVDAIVIDPIQTVGWSAVLKEAYHAGIPVYVMHQEVDAESRYYQMWVGSDYVQQGRLAAGWLHNYLIGRGRGQEQIRIVAIAGFAGASDTEGRRDGFGHYLAEHDNWKLVVQESNDLTEQGGKEIMDGYLESSEVLDVVICHNDNVAMGVCEALEEAGLSYGKNGDILVISFDATAEGLQSVMDGKINLDIECNAQAATYVEEAVRAVEREGTMLPERQYLPEECYTCEPYPAFLMTEKGRKQMLQVMAELVDG